MINKSITDNGITLTVNSYTVRNDELTIQYTVGHDEKQQYSLDNGVLRRPNILISGKKIDLHTVTIDHKQNGKYTGRAIASLPKKLRVHSHVKFFTSDILGQKGSWTLNF